MVTDELNALGDRQYLKDDWLKAIAKVTEWQGKVVIVSKSQMSDTWEFKENLAQHWVTDSTRIRTELGYAEIIDRPEALKRTIFWSQEHPPQAVSIEGHVKLLNYKDEDAILAECRS